MEVASRKVMVSPEVMAEWDHFRTDTGWPMRLQWGNPDADGWYRPVVIREDCDHEFLREGDICAACEVAL